MFGWFLLRCNIEMQLNLLNNIIFESKLILLMVCWWFDHPVWNMQNAPPTLDQGGEVDLWPKQWAEGAQNQPSHSPWILSRRIWRRSSMVSLVIFEAVAVEVLQRDPSSTKKWRYSTSLELGYVSHVLSLTRALGIGIFWTARAGDWILPSRGPSFCDTLAPHFCRTKQFGIPESYCITAVLGSGCHYQ